MDLAWDKVLPVVASIIIIIAVAIIQEQSRFIAAITATMPMGAPLAIWIVWSAERGNQNAMIEFNGSLLFGLLPTIGFLVVVWWAARAGLKLVPMLAVGYATWVVGLAILSLIRARLGT